MLIKGIDTNDQAGYSVSSAGDVDGDGLDDIIIGANQATSDSGFNVGESYLVFGATLTAAGAGNGEIDLAASLRAKGS